MRLLAHDACHDLVCNGDRSRPRGATGAGCSCLGRDAAYADVRDLQATIERLQQENAELRMVTEAAEQAEMAYHNDCVRAETALTALQSGIGKLLTDREWSCGAGPSVCDECDDCGQIVMCSYHSLLSELCGLIP